MLGRLQLGDDPGQSLRQRVMNLPRHPLPLIEDPGLPGLGQQLPVQTLVPGQRRLDLRLDSLSSSSARLR